MNASSVITLVGRPASVNDEGQPTSAATMMLRLGLTGAVTVTLFGCFATAPTIGGSGNTVTGAAAGEHTENGNSALEQTCVHSCCTGR